MHGADGALAIVAGAIAVLCVIEIAVQDIDFFQLVMGVIRGIGAGIDFHQRRGHAGLAVLKDWFQPEAGRAGFLPIV